ncbi:hypothetical protein ACET3Z_013671 [Daucus carota]
MGYFSGMLSCFQPSSSARVNDKENAKEAQEPCPSSSHKSRNKSSGSKAPIPLSYFPVIETSE